MSERRLSADEVDFIMHMKKVEYTNVEIARKLGVTEGAIRYRIKRGKLSEKDGRGNKPSCVDQYRKVIDIWVRNYEGSRHRPTLKTLHETLRAFHGYTRSYDAVRRYVVKHFPEFVKKGARIRVETPPGALVQVDWKEDLLVQMGECDRWVKVHALCFTLGFSRKMVVQFSEKKDLESFLRCHQEAFRAFGGLPHMVRTDCLKSAVVRWKGGKSVLNERYRNYLLHLGIQAFPARPGTPQDKGKVEKKIRDVFGGIDYTHRVFKDMADLQASTDEQLTQLEKKWRCGATGLTVTESFAYEHQYLSPLPVQFPRSPVKERRTRVRRDGTVYFSGNYYIFPGPGGW